MFGKFLRADVAHAIFLFIFFQHVDDVAAAGFRFTVDITADGGSLLSGFVGNFFGETKVESVHRAGLDAERLLILADPIAAHGALAGFAGDVVLGDDLPWTGMDAVLATDASLFVDDHRAFFVFRNRFHRTNRGTCRKRTMHAAIARPER